MSLILALSLLSISVSMTAHILAENSSSTLLKKLTTGSRSCSLSGLSELGPSSFFRGFTGPDGSCLRMPVTIYVR